MTPTTTEPSPISTDTSAPEFAPDAIAERVTATLLTAFAADPISRWYWPTASAYLVGFRGVLHGSGAASGSGAALDLLADDVAAAVWEPPDWHADAAFLTAVVERTVAPHRLQAAITFFDLMQSHTPAEPHWYLPYMGVDPTRQGRGHGTEVLRIGLERCDRDGTLAHLEATNPDALRLYERHRFEVTGEIQVADSPPLWPMTRRPDTRGEDR